MAEKLNLCIYHHLKNNVINILFVSFFKGRKKTYKKPEYEDFNWEAKSHGALILLHNVIQLPLNKLWEPPIAEEEFVK